MSLHEVLSQARQALAIKLFDIAGAPVTLATALSVAVVVVATFYVSHLLQRGLERVLRRRQIVDDGNLGVGKRLLHYVVLFGCSSQTDGPHPRLRAGGGGRGLTLWRVVTSA